MGGLTTEGFKNLLQKASARLRKSIKEVKVFMTSSKQKMTDYEGTTLNNLHNS